MGQQLFANNVSVALATTASSGATTLVVADGSAFPAIGAGSGDWFLVTLDDGSAVEIVRVNAHAAGDPNLTSCVRGYEGTAAAGFASSNTTVSMRNTAGTMDGLNDRLSALESVAPAPEAQGTWLVSGGSVAFASGLTFTVGAAEYYVNGVRFTAPQTNVTLDAANGSFDRFDAVVATTSGTITKVTGTASANPVLPDINPETQIALTYINVRAGAVVAPVTQTNIYLENTEWASSVSGGTFNAASTLNPFAGTKDVEATNAAANDFVRLTNGAAISLADKKQLVLNVRSKASWPSPKSLQVTWYNGGTKVGQSVALASGKYGFVSGTLGVYQQVVIPVSAFAVPTSSTVDRLEFKVSGSGGTIGFHLDNVILETGSADVTQPSIGAATTTALGLVRVDANDANPQVYLKASADAKFAYRDMQFGAAFGKYGAPLDTVGLTKVTLRPRRRAGTITKVVIVPQGGTATATFGVKKCAAGSFPGSLASITGGTDPSISASSGVATVTTFAGWTTAFAVDDVFEIEFKTFSGTATALSIHLLAEPA